MSSETVIQRRNLESEMLFLRQEHAKTLKGLHEEIKVLQKRCTDLTFKLTMQGLHTEDTTELEAKVKKLQSELDASKSNETRLLDVLTKEHNKIKELEIQLKYQNIKHNQELSSKDKEVNSLRADLDYKSNYIGHLSTELHKAKIQLKLEENLNMKSKENVYHVVPVPPKNGRGESGGRRSRRGGHGQKGRSDEVESLNEAWHSPSPSSGGRSSGNNNNNRNHGGGGSSRLNSPHQPPALVQQQQQQANSSPSSSLDLSEPAASSPPQFPNRDHHHHHHHHHHHRHPGSAVGNGNHNSSSFNGNHHHHHNNNNNNNMCSNMTPSTSLLIKSKPGPRLLPPIRQNGGQIQSQNLRHVYVKNVVRPHCFRPQSCDCSGPQVETLAVEQIGRLDGGWRNAHHPKSAEYK